MGSLAVGIDRSKTEDVQRGGGGSDQSSPRLAIAPTIANFVAIPTWIW